MQQCCVKRRDSWRQGEDVNVGLAVNKCFKESELEFSQEAQETEFSLVTDVIINS